MNNKILVDILDKTLDKKYWFKSSETKHLTGHMYYMSPFETDDSCGNCDGARCDYCKQIVVPARFEFVAQCTDLVNMLKECGVPEEDAEDIVYCDGSYPLKTNYRLINPTQSMLEEKFPEFFNSLS